MPPDPDHTRPDGASDALVATTGRLTEALEYVERARGALYTNSGHTAHP